MIQIIIYIYTLIYIYFTNSIHNRLQSHFNFNFTFVLSFQRYTQSICSFHILIHKYSITYSFTYTHSCILIHKFTYVYSFIYSFTYTHSYAHVIYSSIYSFRIFLSFVIIFWLYVIIIIYHLTTLCVHDILPFMFTFVFQFVFIFIFHNHFHVS